MGDLQKRLELCKFNDFHSGTSLSSWNAATCRQRMLEMFLATTVTGTIVANLHWLDTALMDNKIAQYTGLTGQSQAWILDGPRTSLPEQVLPLVPPHHR